MSDTAVAATDANAVNPSQAGPGPTPAPVATPAPNADEAKTPEQIAAEQAAAAETPVVGDEGATDPALIEPTSTADENGVHSYPATGDVGMDMALEFVGKLGIGMDHPAMQATLNNDFGPIEAVLHQMGDKAKGFEKYLSLAKDANAKALDAAKTRSDGIAKAVTGVLGQNQKAVLAWASKAATPDEKKSINAMLAADPVQARAAATILLNAYNKAAGNVIQPASATTVETGDAPTQSMTRISRAEFARETNKLHRQHGAAYTQTPEYRQLSARLG